MSSPQCIALSVVIHRVWHRHDAFFFLACGIAAMYARIIIDDVIVQLLLADRTSVTYSVWKAMLVNNFHFEC